MRDMVEQISGKISEAFQAPSFLYSNKTTNIFYRRLITHESTDLSFINGIVATGLRGSALLHQDNLSANFKQIQTASRLHLPWVVHVNLGQRDNYSTFNAYDLIYATQNSGCFQLVASSAQEEVYLTLIAHRIAELSLIPGMVIAAYDANEKPPNFPEDQLMRKYIGNPDDKIPCPTPAQEIIFGKSRRRIPAWFNFDLPMSMGSSKNSQAISLEKAANLKYFHEHLPQLIKQSFCEFKELFGISLEPVESKSKSSKYAIIGIGGQIDSIFEKLSKDHKKLELIKIKQLFPFPHEALTNQLKGKRAIGVFDQSMNGGQTNSFLNEHVRETVTKSELPLYAFNYSFGMNSEELGLSIQQMISNNKKQNYFVGFDFTKDSSAYPKQEVLLQEIDKQYPELKSDSLSIKNNKFYKSKGLDVEIPMALRRFKDMGPNYSKLSRFYSDTAYFYAHNLEDEIVADPFAAVPVLPASTAGLFNENTTYNSLASIDTNLCTGCGACFVHCPHTALHPTVIGVEELLTAASRLASEKGAPILKFTPIIKNFSKVSAKIIKESTCQSAKDILIPAFDHLKNQMNWEAEKLNAIQLEFDSILNEVGNLPVSVTDLFYKIPHSIDNSKGELFSITIDPNACTACDMCVQVCEEEAISMVSKSELNFPALKEQYKLWERLPDVKAETLNRMYSDESYNSLSAMMLSRNYNMSMAGSQGIESHIPYKSLIHIITSAVESVIQPKIVSEIKRIEASIEKLSENIHQILSTAIPKSNLEGLSKTLKATKGKQLSVENLLHELAEVEHQHLLDSDELNRKVSLVEELNKLKWTLSEGPTGIGRARFGILLAGAKSLTWARQYPFNPFSSPCFIHWNGSVSDQLLGLFLGHLRYLLDHFKLLRRAELEAKNIYDPMIHDLEISSLSLEDLREDEKSWIPPIILMAERADLNEAGWNGLNKILGINIPIKIFLIDHLASAPSSAAQSLSQSFSGLLSAIALKKAFVFQGGMADVNHFFKGLQDGVDKAYPALYNLYATDFSKHNALKPNWSRFSSLALNSRSLPLVKFDPDEKSNFLSGAIDLNSNKDIQKNWVNEKMELANGEKIDYKICWADWAYTQNDWQSEFQLVDHDSSCKMLADYVELNESARKALKPVIVRGIQDGIKYYVVSQKVVEMTELVLTQWNTIRELSGLLTEYPEKLKVALNLELKSKFEKDLAALKLNYEEQLKNHEAAQTEILRQRLKDKLIALSMLAQKKQKLKTDG